MSKDINSVRYEHEQYDALRQTYRKWWNNELERPLVPIITSDYPSSREPSPYPGLSFMTAWDHSLRPDQIMDAHDAYFATLRWHGDAFPFINTNGFGPGVMAAFLGCTPISRPDTVWFQPPEEDIPITELHFEYNPNNPYLQRVLEFYEACMDRWHGKVILGMVDMGGILDILQSFRGAENLLMDLYDDPDEVLRCIDELQKLWFVYYDKINQIIAPETEGYSQWFNLYGEQPGYILQSDFSYMIGPDMFDRFVKLELASSSARLTNAVYHLDGIGELPHLDSILSIETIRGIQWVPGAGAPETMNWDEVLEKILTSGKKLLSCCQRGDGLPIELAKNHGQLYFYDRYFSSRDMDRAKKFAELYRIEL